MKKEKHIVELDREKVKLILHQLLNGLLSTIEIDIKDKNFIIARERMKAVSELLECIEKIEEFIEKK